MKQATFCALLLLCNAAEAAAAGKWEYAVLSREEVRKRGQGDFAAGLNALGEEGWEMVAIGPGVPAPPVRGARPPADFFFKRPKAAKGAKAAPAQAAAKGVTRVFRLKNASPATVVKIVEKLHGQKLGQLAADERTNSLVAAGTADQLANLAALLKVLDEPTDGTRPGGNGEKK